MLPDVNVNLTVFVVLAPLLLTNTPPPELAVQPTMLPPASVQVLPVIFST